MNMFWHFPAPSAVAPSGVSFYRQVTVNNTGGAKTLGSLITGGIPSWTSPGAGSGSSYLIYPTRVSLAVVSGQAGSPTVRVTCDGRTAPTSSLGWLLAEEPGYFGFQVPGQLSDDTNVGIQLLASADTTLVTCIFEA